MTYYLCSHYAGDHTDMFEEFGSLTEAQTAFNSYTLNGPSREDEYGLELVEWSDDEYIETLDYHEW